MPAKKKTAAQSTDGSVWRTRYTGPGAAPDGTPIRIGLADLTTQRLIQMADWFGEDFSIPAEVFRRLFLNEARATMCAVWIGLQKAGRPVQDARELDFNYEEHFEALEDVQPEKADPPTPGAKTDDSAGPS